MPFAAGTTLERLERLAQFHFAALTAIGGVLLSSGEVGNHLPITAVVAAIVAYLFVDRWKVFSLPTVVAYVGMGGVAAFCMANFLWLRPNSQLMSVAQLLVYVEIVLLFQKKSVRVFEQIGVFCLLELIVAAVFNSALLFGVMLVPFALIGLRALVLLQAMSLFQLGAVRDNGIVKTNAMESMQAVARRSLRLPRYGVAVLTPSVLLVACVFFYGLPRAGGSADATPIGGRVTTGFTDVLTLDQVGKLKDNQDLVMRLTLNHARTGKTYRARQPIYMRGQVLEEYDVEHGTGLWKAAPTRVRTLGAFLPDPFVTESDDFESLFDEVLANAEMQPLTSNSLFAIAPYYTSHRDEKVEHVPGKWLLRRRDDGGFASRSRFSFRYGTNAFRNGIQSPFIRYIAQGEGGYRGGYSGIAKTFGSSDPPTYELELREHMMSFDINRLPSVAIEAAIVAEGIGERPDARYQLCRLIERHLSSSGRFTYTKELTEKRDRSVDPLEEFVAKYRRGHCQYFASAMVMMLRSQGIPARIVVGYRSEEFNELGGHYIVRQSHAHAWVEALLDEKELPAGVVISGQPEFGPLLVRFDPTPAESTVTAMAPSRVSHFYDFAQSFWNSYVLDMNSERQAETLFGQTDAVGVGSAYSRMLTQLQIYASSFSAREFGPGALADPSRFSWRAAFLSVTIALILFGLYQMGVPQRLGRKWVTIKQTESVLNKSSVPFFQQLSETLAAKNIIRSQGQTPEEFAAQASAKIAFPLQGSARNPMQNIIHYFYRVRFSGNNILSESEREIVNEDLAKVEQAIVNIR